ncbi:MAG: hypothetical protein N2D54_00865 [Chloroflexota bacterium]
MVFPIARRFANLLGKFALLTNQLKIGYVQLVIAAEWESVFGRLALIGL